MVRRVSSLVVLFVLAACQSPSIPSNPTQNVPLAPSAAAKRATTLSTPGTFVVAPLLSPAPGNSHVHWVARDINDAGVIVGFTVGPWPSLDQNRAVVWHDGNLPPTYLSGDAGTQALGINDAGDIVGTQLADGHDWIGAEALLWKPDGTVVDLGHGVAKDIDDDGTIVGWKQPQASSDLQAVVWEPNGSGGYTSHALPQYSGLDAALAVDGNWIVGVDELSVPWAVAWERQEDGTWKSCSVQVPGGPLIDVTQSWMIGSWGVLPYRFPSSCGLIDRGTLVDSSYVVSDLRPGAFTALNERGDVVGAHGNDFSYLPGQGWLSIYGFAVNAMSAQGSSVSLTGFLWRDGVETPLPSLNPPIQYEVDVPYAVNDQDVIVGTANAVGPAVWWRPESAVLAELLTTTQELLAGSVNKGQANSMLVKLQAALKQVQAGKPGPAVNQLKAFLNELQSMEKTGKLPEDAVLILRGDVQALLSLLGG